MRPNRGWILIIAWIVGCSSSSSSTGAPIPIDQLDEEVARARCDLLLRCCTAAELFPANPDATRDECAASLAGDVAKDVGELQAVVASGRVVYDGAAARACIESIAARACSGTVTEPACDRMLEGTLADGQPCESPVECVSGFCSRTCKRRPSVGEPCEGFECVEGAYCDRASFTCAGQKPIGAPCEGSEECQSDYCDSTARTCTAPKPNGSPCSGSDECMSGSFCDPESRTCADYREGLCYAR